MDEYSFVLGMITAFCECVAGGCKRMALSPPINKDMFEKVKDQAYEVIERHGLLHYHEENLDLPEEDRVEWIIIAAKDETIEEYLKIRAEGYSPVKGLRPFWGVLSYDPEEAVITGYDAYREFFREGKYGCKEVDHSVY